MTDDVAQRRAEHPAGHVPPPGTGAVHRLQALGPQRQLLVVVERFQGGRGSLRGPGRGQRPAEQEVGQCGVAGQHRAVQIGAEHPSRPGALGPVAARRCPPRVPPGPADGPAGRPPTPRRGSRNPSAGAAGRPRRCGVHRRSASPPTPPPPGHRFPCVVIRSSRPTPSGAGRGVGERPADQLEPGTHPEHHRTLGHPLGQGAVLQQSGGRPHLGAVLAPAHRVEVGRGQRPVGRWPGPVRRRSPARPPGGPAPVRCRRRRRCRAGRDRPRPRRGGRRVRSQGPPQVGEGRVVAQELDGRSPAAAATGVVEGGQRSVHHGVVDLGVAEPHGRDRGGGRRWPPPTDRPAVRRARPTASWCRSRRRSGR